jgi:hypothetical protein
MANRSATADVDANTLDQLTNLVGPRQASEWTRDLTLEEDQAVDEVLARHGGDPVAALNMHHLPEATKAEMRRVMGFQA